MIQQAEVDALSKSLKVVSKESSDFHKKGALKDITNKWSFALDQDNFEKQWTPLPAYRNIKS
jgi:hypothetical protein